MRAALPDEDLPGLRDRWESLGWQEQQWLAVLLLDDSLYHRLLDGMAKVSARFPLLPPRQDVTEAAGKALGRQGPSPVLVQARPLSAAQVAERERRRLALERQAIRAARAARYVAGRPDAPAPDPGEVEVRTKPVKTHLTSTSPARPTGLRVRRPAKPKPARPGGALPAYTMSEREAQMVALAAQGLSNDEIARVLTISVDTVKTMTARARRRYGARNTTHLVAMALERGQISLAA